MIPKHLINFTQPKRRFALSLLYNGINSFLFADATIIYQFKAKGSEIKDYTLCLVNNYIDTNDVWDIHR